ncbi:unnamed protein product, partial [Amoebophrya sp. A25]
SFRLDTWCTECEALLMQPGLFLPVFEHRVKTFATATFAAAAPGGQEKARLTPLDLNSIKQAKTLAEMW